MFLLDSMLVGGIRFVLDKVVEAAAAEADDEQALREDLLAAQMRLELGELDQQEFAEIEGDLLGRLREINARRRGKASGPLSTGAVSGVEVNFGGDHD
jgi:gas vesicle protein GvpG